jgi:hypothetical protein
MERDRCVDFFACFTLRYGRPRLAGQPDLARLDDQNGHSIFANASLLDFLPRVQHTRYCL